MQFQCKKWVLATAAMLMFAVTASVSSAAVLINSSIVGGEINAIEDTDFERLLLADGVTPDPSKIISVGDILESVLKFTTVNGEALTDIYGSPYQLSVHAQARVKAISAPHLDGTVDVTFDPGFSATEAVRLYENPLTTTGAGGTRVNFNAQTVAQATAAGTSGSLVATFGFGQSTDFWSAINVPLSVTGPYGLTNSYFFGLSMLTNPGGILIDTGTGITAFNPLDPATASPSPAFVNVDIRANGTLKTRPTGVDAGWDAQTDTDVQFVGLPEPGMFVTWGVLVGLAGVFTYFRKRTA